MFAAIESGHDEPELPAVLGAIGDAQRHRVAGTGDGDRLPSSSIVPASAGGDPEERQPDVGASRADQTGETQAPPRRGGRTRRPGRRPRGADPRTDSRTAPGCAPLALEQLPHLATDHVAGWRWPASARARGVVEIQRPSRRIVTRSAISKTSSMRWEMKRIATPCWRRACTMRKSRCTSCAESDAVGSSMISTRTSSEMALAISTVCCSARVRPRAGSPTSRLHVEPGEDLARLAFHAPPVDDLAPIAVADEDVLGDRQVGEDHRLLVDGGDAEALGILGRGDADRLAIDAGSRRCPAAGRRS